MFITLHSILYILSAVYPELAALIEGSVPNYRGIFLRGHGPQTSTYYGAMAHGSAGIDQLQGNRIWKIWGELSYLPRNRDGEVGQSGSLAFWNEGRNQWMNDAGKAPSGAMNFYASRSTPVVGEVRPVNRAVRYLIRARWLAKSLRTPYSPKQKGPRCANTSAPGMGWFFKGLPSGKRFSTYLPDGDPQRCSQHCWRSLHSIGLAF